MSARPPSVVIVGAGKVGRALRRGLAAAGTPVMITPARRPSPRALGAADVLVIAARDDRIRPLAEMVAEYLRARASSERRPRRPRAALHCAGAREPEELEILRALGVAIGQMHPLLSFADPRRAPALRGASVLVRGDRVAVREARRIARALGMLPREIAGLHGGAGGPSRFDAAAYHAAASIVANGAAALAGLGVELLVASGFERKVAPSMLGPLLCSVGQNVLDLGLPDALTGPVRRGDRDTLSRHLACVRRISPASLALYLALVRAQLDLARNLGDAPPGALESIDAWLAQDATDQRKSKG